MTAIRFRGLTEGIWRKNRNRAADAKENMLRGLLGWGTSYFVTLTKGIFGTRKTANYMYFGLVRYELLNLVCFIYLQQS